MGFNQPFRGCVLSLSIAMALSLPLDVRAEAEEMDAILVYGREIIDPADPTEPTKLSKQQLKKQKHSDVMRILKQVPGVQMREEDAFGLRPNIGMRGTNPDRSKKIVLMEDGVLIAPAPYSAPAAYYTPSMVTTEGLEVYKGFSSLPYGPNSVGGGINYLSKGFSSKPNASAQISGGSFGTLDSRIEGSTNWGKVKVTGVLGRLQTDGFKELGSDLNTGFEKTDVLVKGQFKANKNNTVSIKIGVTDELSNESYLGLTLNDFNEAPFRRYISSENDQMDAVHLRTQIQHELQIDANSYIQTSVYMNRFDRTWSRLDRFSGQSTNPQLTLSNILLNPTSGINQNFYDILTGQADSSSSFDNLVIANNNRQFVSGGLQTQYFLNSDFSHDTSNELQLQMRFHYDRAELNHTFDTFAMTAGRLESSGLPTGIDQLTEGDARAFTMTAQDKITLGKWAATVIGRYETINFRRRDRVTNVSSDRSDQFFVPGAGLSYSFTPAFALKASVNRAVNVAGVNFIGQATREEATNYEIGFRYQSNLSPMYAELTYFANDYDNIAGICSVSSGCSTGQIGTQFDGGQALIHGAEAVFGYESRYRGFRFPIQGSISLIQAEFSDSFNSSSPEWGIGQINEGDRLPYVPKVQYSINAGVQYRKLTSYLSLTYQSDMVDQSVEDGQVVVPAFGVLDISTDYQFTKSLRFFAKMDNVFKKDYVVAARPFGLRPGKPQTILGGLTYTF